MDVVNTVSASLELGFTLEPALSLPEALWTNCATLLVLLALVPLGALLGLGVVRLRSFWLVFVSSFPFVLLPLCISVTPGWLPLMALVLGWVVPALIQKEECLEVYDMAIDGRNRRYYKITEKGRVQLNLYKGEWAGYSRKISQIFEEALI